MTQDKNKTEVLFLIEKSEDNEEKTVFAFFPNEGYNSDQNMKISYAHIGQHSGCHKEYASECKQATKEQYSDLKTELESIGYNLTILNK